MPNELEKNRANLHWIAVSSIVIVAGVIVSFCVLSSRNILAITDTLYTVHDQYLPMQNAIEQLQTNVSATQESYMDLLDFQDRQWDETYQNWEELYVETENQLEAFLQEADRAGIDGMMVENITRAWLRIMRASLDAKSQGGAVAIDTSLMVQTQHDYLLVEDAIKIALLAQRESYAQQMSLWQQRARTSTDQNILMAVIAAVVVIAIIATLAVRFWILNYKLYKRHLIKQLVLHSIYEGFLMVNAQKRRLEFVSHNVSELLGIDFRESHTGYRVWTGFAKSVGILKKDTELLMSANTGDATVERVIQVNHNGDNRERWIHCCLYPVRADRAANRYIVTLSDRTKSHSQSKKLAETLQEAIEEAQEQKALLNNMSHEMRTPLSSILSLVANAKNDLAKPNHLENVLPSLNKIQISCEHLLTLTNEVLDSAKIRSGKLKIAREEFTLDALVSDVASIICVQTASKNQRFMVVVDHEPFTCLWGDPLHVKQILINLLSNAVKFTPARGDIRLEIHCADAQNGRVDISFVVKDNGIGMSKDFEKKIFLPFEQEGRAHGQSLGTGLGMNICKNLADLMGGNIAVHSALDNGTTFTVELAFETAEPQEVPKVIPAGQLRMLAIGNDAMEAGATMLMLQQLGIAADAVPSYERAKTYLCEAKAAGRPYHICLLGGSLAESDALWVSRNIREDLQDTGIKLLRIPADWTGQAIPGNEYIDGILEKPVLRGNLYAGIIKVLKDEPAKKQEIVVTVESLKGYRILLADDNEINRDIFRDWLNMAGAEVVCVQDGIQLFETFANSAPGTYHAIVMDLRMPRMDGWRTTWTIRHSGHADGPHIPIVGTTASTNEEERFRAVENGMNYCLIKPVSAADLYGVLQQYIGLEVKDGTKICS